MRRIPILFLASLVIVALSSGAASASARSAVNECTLLTKTQVATIMGTKPVSKAPDNEGCSWSTDPLDRANLAYVTTKVVPQKTFVRDYPDVRTAIDESTNVGIEPLDGVGSEAFLTYSPLTGEGYVDGVTVRIGKQVLTLGFQPVERVANPSEQLDDIVSVVKKMVAKVKAQS